jgi:hypothetical protein
MVFYQRRCLISPQQDETSLAWIKFLDGHLEGGLCQMHVFYIREAFDHVLANFSAVGSLLSRPRSGSEDTSSAPSAEEASSLKSVDLKLHGPKVHLAGARRYAATASASEWVGEPDGLTVDLGTFTLQTRVDAASWSMQMEGCTFFDQDIRLGSASATLAVENGRYLVTLDPVTLALRPHQLARLFDIWYGNIYASSNTEEVDVSAAEPAIVDVPQETPEEGSSWRIVCQDWQFRILAAGVEDVPIADLHMLDLNVRSAAHAEGGFIATTLLNFKDARGTT